MNAQDIVQQCRNVLAEPSQNRFNDQYLMAQASIVQRAIAIDLDFPQGTFAYTTVSGQQEYQLDMLSKILRVYIKTASGSLVELVPSDIPTLEGDLLERYDNTSGTVVGSPSQSPQMFTQQPQVYPPTNCGVGGTAASTYPYRNAANSGQRPSYYLRGGFIGILPPDVNSGDTIVVDCIIAPPDLSALTQFSPFPRTFIMAIVWGVVKICRVSDQNAQYQLADAEYEKEMAKLNMWRMNKLQQGKPKVFVPRTARTDFRPGNGGGWGGSW